MWMFSSTHLYFLGVDSLSLKPKIVRKLISIRVFKVGMQNVPLRQRYKIPEHFFFFFTGAFFYLYEAHNHTHIRHNTPIYNKKK